MNITSRCAWADRGISEPNRADDSAQIQYFYSVTE
jgi:hypothetical protein